MSNLTSLNQSSTSHPSGPENIPELFPVYVDVILKFLYVLVTASGIAGNSLIIYLVATKRVNRTAFNILLTNLSVSDLIANIALYPYIFINIKGHNVNSTTGNVLCTFTIGVNLFFICASVSLLSLTIISINRFICINYPLKFIWHLGKSSCKILSAFSWMFAFVITFPNLISFRYIKDWGICKREWPSAINGKVYSTVTAVLALIVPTTVLFCTFIITAKNLRTKVHDVQFSHDIHQRSRRRTIHLLGWLIAVFCICWAPFWIYWILSRSVNIFDKGNLGDYQRMRVIRVILLIASLNSVADPFLYGFFSENFRRELRLLFHRQRENQRKETSRFRTTSSALASTRQNIINEPSCYSIKAIDEEVSGKLTPKSSKAMARVREANKLPESNF